MKKLIILGLAISLSLPFCTSRQRTGEKGNNGNGGVIAPDSTTRDDTTVPKRAADTLMKK